MGIFVHQAVSFSPFSFLSIFERKYPGPTIYFPSSPSNQTHSKKVFLPIFSPKFSIHLISPPNKHTLKVAPMVKLVKVIRREQMQRNIVIEEGIVFVMFRVGCLQYSFIGGWWVFPLCNKAKSIPTCCPLRLAKNTQTSKICIQVPTPKLLLKKNSKNYPSPCKFV